MTDELPAGWAEAVLSDVFDNLDSKRIPINSAERAQRLATAGDRYPYYGATGQVGEIDEFLFNGEAVLLGEDGAPFLDARKRKAYLVDGKYWVNNHAHILRAKSEMSNAFFCHQLNAIDYRPYVAGTTRLKLTQAAMNDIRLVVAPATEQQRIVSKIDELFSRIGEGERALERVQKLVERYRQSVLKAAVTGELTRDWRDNNKDQLESGEALLARILKSRREAWENAELDKMKVKGITPANDKWKQKYEEPAAPDTADLPELPTGWQWASLEQIAAPEKYAVTDGPFGSNLKTEHYTDSGPRVVRLQNIKDGAFADERAHISAAHFDQLQKHHIFAGDLLIAALGESLPRVCLVPEELGPAIVKADCVRFKASPNILAECVMAFLNSPPSRNRTKKIIHGVGRPRLNLEEIRALVVPVPSMAEQVVIADRIRIQVGLVEHMLVEQEQLSMRVTALRQSTLSRAFRGGLVQQDTNDEPASMLLRRIASTCNEAPAKPKRGRKPKTSEPA